MPRRNPVNLLVALVTRDEGGALDILGTSGFDPAAFASFASRHQVAGYVYSELSRLPRTGARAGASVSLLLEGLRTRHEWQVEKSQAACRDLEELSQLFRSADCDFLLLKGLYLAQRFYQALDRRTFWDIDLLVTPAARPLAQRLLRDAGFQRTSGLLFGERLSTRFTHGFDFVRPGCKVDLHWALATHPSFAINYEELWARASSYELCGSGVRVLDDEMMVASGLVSTFEDIQRGAFRMRSFVDLFMMLEELDSRLDWSRFFDRRRDEGLRKLCAAVAQIFIGTFEVSHSFPRFSKAVDAIGVLHPGEEIVEKLLSGSAVTAGHKRWAFSLYETSVLGTFGWWLLSLPFRIAVHGSPGIRRSATRPRRQTSRHQDPAPGRTQR